MTRQDRWPPSGEPSKSICPSDAARAVGGDDWRELMDDARDADRALARAGEVEITQKGAVLDPDSVARSGPDPHSSHPTIE